LSPYLAYACPHFRGRQTCKLRLASIDSCRREAASLISIALSVNETFESKRGLGGEKFAAARMWPA